VRLCLQLTEGRTLVRETRSRAAEAGITATRDGSLAHQRLTQMRDFYMFLFDEIPALLDRWYQRSRSSET
jgi:hypothetical protein